MKVLFTNSSFSEKEVKRLAGDNIEIIAAKADLSEEELKKQLEGCEGYVMGGTDRASAEVLKGTELKGVIFYGAGYEDYVDVPVASKEGIQVANTPGANAYTVAEFTVGLIMEAVKNISWLNKTTKAGEWNRRRTWTLKGKTLGVIGMGTIGTHVAMIMHKAFDMKVLYVSRSEKPEVESAIGAQKVILQELLKKADVVSIHSLLNKETENMIGKAELEGMKESAVLVNVARAKIVNGTELKEALESNDIAKAVFDAYYDEPSPSKKDDKVGLLSLGDDKFVITPHTAYNSEEAFSNMNAMVIENLLALAANKDMPYKVN